jgi:4-hydroxybenzoate polyprenyltransferase
MTLNRIIDRNIDAENPRTAQRHLASGTMSISTAWTLAVVFLAMLLLGAGMLNEVALAMSWLPVLTFVVYPYTKRFTWLCHLWLGLCLGLAPAGAWVAIAGDFHGWEAITGTDGIGSGLLWYPTIFFISLGVTLWITAFDINYARMDVESDRKHGINSFPARFSEKATTRTSIQLTLLWFACFALADPMEEAWFLIGALIMALANAYVMLRNESLDKFQDILFKVSVSTGWVLILPFLFL